MILLYLLPQIQTGRTSVCSTLTLYETLSETDFSHKGWNILPVPGLGTKDFPQVLVLGCYTCLLKRSQAIGSQLLALHCPRAKKHAHTTPLLWLGKFVLQRERGCVLGQACVGSAIQNE